MNFAEQIKRDGNLLTRTVREKKDRKPLRRTRLLRGSTPVKRVSKRRAKQRRQYRPVHAAHLKAHPFCQLTIAFYDFSEERVLGRAVGLDASNCQGIFYQGVLVPIATEVHHRNKANGERLTDSRWFASSCRKMYDWVEANKSEARAEGFLLPFEADKDGRLPDGTQCPTTDEWIALRSQHPA